MPQTMLPAPVTIVREVHSDGIAARAKMPPTELEITLLDRRQLVWSGALRIHGSQAPLRTSRSGQASMSWMSESVLPAACGAARDDYAAMAKESLNIRLEPNEYLGGPGEFTISVSWERPTSPVVCSLRENTTTKIDRKFDVVTGGTVTLQAADLTLKVHRR